MAIFDHSCRYYYFSYFRNEEMDSWKGWQVNFIVLMQHPELKLGNLLPESILLVTTYYCLTSSNSIHEGNDNKGYNDILCFCLGY